MNRLGLTFYLPLVDSATANFSPCPQYSAEWFEIFLAAPLLYQLGLMGFGVLNMLNRTVSTDLYLNISTGLGTFFSFFIQWIVSLLWLDPSPYYDATNVVQCGQSNGITAGFYIQYTFFYMTIAFLYDLHHKHMFTKTSYAVFTLIPVLSAIMSLAMGYTSYPQAVVSAVIGVVAGTIMHFIAIWVVDRSSNDGWSIFGSTTDSALIRLNIDD